MDTDNYGVINCSEDDEHRVSCNICDKLCIEKSSQLTNPYQ